MNIGEIKFNGTIAELEASEDIRAACLLRLMANT